MIKISYHSSTDPKGPPAIPLFTSGTDGFFEKVAMPTLMPDVVRYIEALKPRANAQYVLVNAMGAGEYWGANVNSDYFSEASLVHSPDDWTGLPLLDAIKARDWPYGYPTFYNAKPFLHHRNKPGPPTNHPYFGEVELALWHPRMKRVELVLRIDKDLCISGGGTGLWDKLKSGGFPDLSMGTKVPFDTSSITLDQKLYNEALATFNPKVHKYPGEAVLKFHKALIEKHGKGHGIRGLSVTTKDYDEYTKANLGRILPDGRKVFVYNDFPNFFDISFVFIGADRTAKTMMKIAEMAELTPVARAFYGAPSGPAEQTDFQSPGGGDPSMKPDGDGSKEASLKKAKWKAGEIVKDTIPSQFAAKAVPLLAKKEPGLPRGILDTLATRSPEEALSTVTGVGIVLRPHEFQRMTLKQLGKDSLADQLEQEGLVFPRSKEEAPLQLSEGLFNPVLAQLLLPFLASRSAFGPFIERRCVMVVPGEKAASDPSPSLSTPLLRKISAAYNGYRRQMLNLVTGSQAVLSHAGGDSFSKLAHCPVDELFTSLSAFYLRDAFLDEVGEPTIKQAKAGVERDHPQGSRESSQPISGDST